MIQFLKQLLSVLIITTTNANHAQIEHIPNVTLDDCGVGREPLIRNKTCFKYHNSFDIFSKIQNGRNVMFGEMPWIAYIIINLKNQNKYKIIYFLIDINNVLYL